MFKKIVSTTVVVLLCLMVNLIAINPITTQAAVDVGNGSAGDVVISTTKNLSSFSNKNFRNLTIGSGGTLIVDTDETIYVSQTLLIKDGGRITSTNGANGYTGSRYDYDYWVYFPVPATPGKAVVINATNINVQTNGSINSGVGGTGHPARYDSSGRWGPGGGGNGGLINLNFNNSLIIDNGTILSGDGGLAHTDVAYKSSGGAGGTSGDILISGPNIDIKNGSTIETGNGKNGAIARSCWTGDSSPQTAYAGNGGWSGRIGISGSTLSLDATSTLKTGLGGKAGVGQPEGSGVNTGAYGGVGGRSGDISFTGFTDITVYGLIQTGIAGEGGYHSEIGYYTPSNGTAGGEAGTITITSNNLHVYPGGKVLGGVGGKGGSVSGYTGGSKGNGGTGGKGGTINLSVTHLILDSNSLISSGNGGLGGDGSGSSSGANGTGFYGGRGGQGGDVTLNLSGTLTKPNEVNIKTGLGGDGGQYTHCYTYSGESPTYYYYYWNGGHGGKGGNATLNLPPGMSIDYNVIEVGSGGTGHDVTANQGTSSGTYYRYYNPGVGGATGDLTVNINGNLTLNASNVFKIAKSGRGNVWTPNTSVKSQNGSSGNVSLNIIGQLEINAENAIFFDDMSHSGYTATNASGLSLNCNNILFNSNRPIKWSNITGGTLTVITDLRQFNYSHEDLTALFKDASQGIGSHIYKFTWVKTEDLFVDIPLDGFQVSQDVSFALDENIYNKFLKLFTNVRRYKSEDGGTNWQEITSGPMTQTWTWNAPATVKGNSRLKIGITPYGFAAGVSEIWLNGVKLNTYWTPTNINPPAIYSYNYAILDTDVGIPTITLTVNDNNEIINTPLVKVSMSAVDNVTPPQNLKYYIYHNLNIGLVSVPYANISEYYYDLAASYGGELPTGYYKITAKVVDENFNTALQSKTIYYMKPAEKPETPVYNSIDAPTGFIVRDWLGDTSLTQSSYEDNIAYISKKNSAKIDVGNSTYPYYQIKIGEGDYGQAIPKGIKHNLRLPPGEGIHFINLRYCNSDKMPGDNIEFVIIVDNTAPLLSVKTVNGATSTRTGSIRLHLTVKDNITTDDNIQYSTDGLDWSALPTDKIITVSGLINGLNNINVKIKDEAGNISEATINVWNL